MDRTRREILAAFTAIPASRLDWNALPSGKSESLGAGKYDAIIIGAGLGGLSCAAAFARQGFKTLVLEKHDKPGGYATTFRRRGGFEFDASLHSTTVGERDGLHNLIPGFPEITDVEFVPHRTLYRAIFPQHDIRVAACDVPGYVKMLSAQFPNEAEGIQGLIGDMQGVADDIRKLSSGRSQPDLSRFSQDYPHLFRSAAWTWGAMVDERLKDPKLKAIISSLWAYYGLPPSKLASFYYAMPTIGYLSQGGYYPKGRSQKISNAMVSFITAHGGEVVLNTQVEKILTANGAVTGVRTADGKQYEAKVVVSNANPFDLFHSMIDAGDAVKSYQARMDRMTPSLSSFQIFLGLKKDLVHELKITDTEVFYEPGYDPEASYQGALAASMDNPGFCATLYDNLYPGYSPAGKNTLSLITLQGYDHWKPYEADYRKGNKADYKAEKERMADVIIRQAERILLPGLAKAIEVREVGTPLTNVRYTGNYRGAIYGWDQTLENSGMRRLGHVTPVKNLYLSSAWTRPGGGYGAVLASGLECFGEIMRTWA